MSGFRIAANTQSFVPPKRRPTKKPAYLEMIRRLPCCISGAYGVQAAHVSFANPWYGAYGRGKGTKVSDRFALPLAPALHDLQHSGRLGKEKEFWDTHGIDPHSLANTLFCLWVDYDEDEAIARATARIRDGIARAKG